MEVWTTPIIQELPEPEVNRLDIAKARRKGFTYASSAIAGIGSETFELEFDEDWFQYGDIVEASDRREYAVYTGAAGMQAFHDAILETV